MTPTHELRNVRIAYGTLDGMISDDGNHVALAPLGAPYPPTPQGPPERRAWLAANGWSVLPRFLSRIQTVREVERLASAGHAVRSFLDDHGRWWEIGGDGRAERRHDATEAWRAASLQP